MKVSEVPAQLGKKYQAEFAPIYQIEETEPVFGCVLEYHVPSRRFRSCELELPPYEYQVKVRDEEQRLVLCTRLAENDLQIENQRLYWDPQLPVRPIPILPSEISWRLRCIRWILQFRRLWIEGMTSAGFRYLGQKSLIMIHRSLRKIPKIVLEFFTKLCLIFYAFILLNADAAYLFFAKTGNRLFRGLMEHLFRHGRFF